eukprot:TRINITY_DN10033_c0_g2_i3.p2 TRINITY_DN10033_c0_g2~~TRINITY_DN10033_c0_g2_i3.p2  ORF type:complete len:720 (+),score=61.27 TRINITY_DN10033_c0_g2_i3:54-2213(+)
MKQGVPEISNQLLEQYSCWPVFPLQDEWQKHYKGCCKQQLWPLLHYVLPMSPLSLGRFDPELWSAYIKVNQHFAGRIQEIMNWEYDYVWIHDYHLMVLPSLLRIRCHRVRCGFFLHSPFPSSEIFKTFPKREELLRSMLNADLVGFHTFDYARHFLSCCSRLLGLQHQTSRGSICLDVYGRTVGIKIMPTGVNPNRLLEGYAWKETKWRREELKKEFEGKTVLLGVDDLDLFKGIELKLLAFEKLLDINDEWRGKIVLVQITNKPRSSGREIEELTNFIQSAVDRINSKYGDQRKSYMPVVWLQRYVPLHEKIAFYSIADCVLVSATRDGMNLVPYEYITSRQGPDQSRQGADRSSMLVVSEFVGCSPSLSGAIRVNPWSIESVKDGIQSAINSRIEERQQKHQNHWRYVSQHTVAYWGQSFIKDLQQCTKNHARIRAYPLGFLLDAFRIVVLDPNFRKLDLKQVEAGYKDSTKRVFLSDYDGTLSSSRGVSQEGLQVLRQLCADENNTVYIVSGRACSQLEQVFSSIPNLGLAAEHGFYIRKPGEKIWKSADDDDMFTWKEMVHPILQLYTEQTDGSTIEQKDSALVWHYRDADPDFGNWQAKELFEHLKSILFEDQRVEVVAGNSIIEVKPRGIGKGRVLQDILNQVQPDFVLCVGDDRSDEDMFVTLNKEAQLARFNLKHIFSCTVGQKPSEAKFFLNDPTEVVKYLHNIIQMVQK